MDTTTDTRPMLVARESFAVEWEGVHVSFVAGVTRIREGHPLIEGREDYFEPLVPHYEWESATARPGEKRR